MPVYIVRMGNLGSVKIGYSSDRCLVDRLRTFDACWPYQPVVIAIIRGGRDKERELHCQFRHLKIRGEWFEAGDELLSLGRPTKFSNYRLIHSRRIKKTKPTYKPKMTHGQLKQRRRDMAAEVAEGADLQAVAHKYGVSSVTVAKACAEHKVRFPRYRPWARKAKMRKI